MCPYCVFPVLFSTPIRSGLGVLKGISVCRVVLFLTRLNPLFGGYVFKIGKLLIVSALGKESCLVRVQLNVLVDMASKRSFGFLVS